MRKIIRIAAVGAASSLLIVALSPSTSSAATSASMRILAVTPRGSAALSGWTTIKAQQDLPGRGLVGPVLTYRASNRSTRFLWDAAPGSTKPPASLTRNAFVARGPAYAYARIDWAWKTDDMGQRYRHVTRVAAADSRSSDQAIEGSLLVLRRGEPYVVRADGTGLRRLLSGTSFARASVLPGGRFVVGEVAAERYHPASALDLWDTTSGQVRRIASAGSDGWLQLCGSSPSGETLLYRDGDRWLCEYDVARTTTRRLLVAQGASFSPDGTTIAWVRNTAEDDELFRSEMGLLDVRTGNSRVLAGGDDFDGDVVGSGLVWEPGGRTLLVSAAAEGSPHATIWRVDAASGAVSRLRSAGWVAGVSGDGRRTFASRPMYRPESGLWEAFGYWESGYWRFMPAGSSRDYDAVWGCRWRDDGLATVLTRSFAGGHDVYVADGTAIGMRRILRGYTDAEWWPGR